MQEIPTMDYSIWNQWWNPCPPTTTAPKTDYKKYIPTAVWFQIHHILNSKKNYASTITPI